MGQESNIEFVYPYTLVEMRRILEDLKLNKFDILHINFLKTFIASFFADEIKIPVVQTIHRDFMERPRIYNIYKEIGFHPNEHFVFVSKSAKERSLLKQNTHAIHNGIEVSDYPFAPATNQSNFLWLSRIDNLKGPMEAALAAKEAGVSLTLCGDIDRDEYQKYFDEEVKPLLSEKIVYEKSSSPKRKIELYQNAKAFIFPIQWEEPFGFVVTEAMSCGTPVIAFNRGAMSEIIEDGVTGYIVPPEKGTGGLVEAIRKINALSQEEYEKMRDRSRKRVEEQFSSRRMADQYEQLYKQLVNSPQ